MSRFPKNEESEEETFSRVGMLVGGTFECNDCGKLANEAINVRREEKLYWKCPDGHENSINFKL